MCLYLVSFHEKTVNISAPCVCLYGSSHSHFILVVVSMLSFSTHSIYTISLSHLISFSQRNKQRIFQVAMFDLQMKPTSSLLPLLLLLVLLHIEPIVTWESYELDLFDLVEELGLNNNFYQFLSVDSRADVAEIKRAYRYSISAD